VKTLSLHYITNRAHEGGDRLRPRRYGGKFSDDGAENLRFGKARLQVSESRLQALLRPTTSKNDLDGERLASFLSEQASRASLRAYRETAPDPHRTEHAQSGVIHGSRKMFAELRRSMSQGRDVLVYVHGYNSTWERAVGSALALQLMLNRRRARGQNRNLHVVLFSWPSDGSLLPFVAYRSDRVEAGASGYALGRALLKLRDFLLAISPDEHCGSNVHLLAHSMGAHVLETALERLHRYAGGAALPRMLDRIQLCAADVDDDALESGRPLACLHELGRRVELYFHREDLALRISDLTKGHPERLGSTGAARPHLLHQKICQIDCTSIAAGPTSHMYHLGDRVSLDIRRGLDGVADDDPLRGRERGRRANTWVLR
jgi:esterase/lipase superfamily enzyme